MNRNIAEDVVLCVLSPVIVCVYLTMIGIVKLCGGELD